MNLRISDGQLRFRITNDELSNLLQGAVLEVILLLPTKELHYSIRAEDIVFPLGIEEHESGFALLVNRKELESFSSREAIEHIVKIGEKDLLLVLEVDFRKSPKK